MKFRANLLQPLNFYIPMDKKINESFHPVDYLGNEITEYNIKKVKDNEFIISFSLQKNFFLSKVPIPFTPDCLFKKNDKKILQTEKELKVSKKINTRIKTIDTKISAELKAIKMENHTNTNLFLSEQEKRISLMPFKNNEKNLKIAQLELERIVALIPIQYREL
ncbi:hypothetical protein [Avibacterium paragallinarum]|uniref:Uncharacterized protein n=2 Tax=Avibacterium paragallinarum TaxID=728 RepID=A0ABU7QI57_AVIPA|nr:hypothetical protein [Avibacterium paragallinarum]MEE3609511.1 hypothetical protein [Avibacterium paragallinarum]MEE3681572.1 hypothetical protein [Avibacterium paragallinarum]MEE4386897.1 hypothetical protein [Avibacterium paragallinarum]QZP16613.1 hypothetical protein K5O18_04730 [Avibacterium paragallinarum]WAL58017.1 hypothetical protein OY678_07635 [Avibacterium paragallinarum]